MKSSIQIVVRIILVVSIGIPLAVVSAQEPSVTPKAQQIGVMSTPQGQIPVFAEGQLPLFGYMSHSRNIRIGSTPASRAAEAVVQAAKSRKWMADIAQGEALMKAGDLNGAVDAFQQMIVSDPDAGLAYRRMAEAYAANGKPLEASQAFHKVLIEGFGPGIGNGVGDTADEWAEYALVLVKTGQSAEAMRCYNHAASLLDFEDSENHGGKPSLKVLLPELSANPTLPEQVQYTSVSLQAFADTTLAHEEMGSGSEKEAIAHMKEAAKLYPASAAIQYYLGEALSRSYHVYLDSSVSDKKATWASYLEDKKATEAAYKKAAELGDDATVAAAKERLAAPR